VSKKHSVLNHRRQVRQRLQHACNWPWYGLLLLLLHALVLVVCGSGGPSAPASLPPVRADQCCFPESSMYQVGPARQTALCSAAAVA